MRSVRLASLFVVAALAFGGPLFAAPPPQTAPAATAESATSAAPDEPEAKLEEARTAFRRGATLVTTSDWSEALAAFEKSYALRPHPVTSFNIGVVMRALGQYTRARRAFQRALTEQSAGVGEMAEDLQDQARTFRAEIDGLLAQVTIDMDPPSASIVVDGRPLEIETEGELPVLVAGLKPAGPGAPPPAKRFIVLLDPGVHVFVISRKGFEDAVVRRELAAGSREKLPLVLDELPATLRISANEKNALVEVDGRDVGPAPVDVRRAAGEYKVRVTKTGFVTYETRVRVPAGGEVDVRVPLKKREPALTEKWWFWSAIGVVTSGAAVATYFAARPEATRPPLDGGGLDWAVRVK